MQRRELSPIVPVDAATAITASYLAGRNLAAAAIEINMYPEPIVRARGYLRISEAIVHTGGDPDISMRLAHTNARIELAGIEKKDLDPHSELHLRYVAEINDIFLSLLELEAERANPNTDPLVEEITTLIDGYSYRAGGQLIQVQHLVRLIDSMMRHPQSFSRSVEEMLENLHKRIFSEDFQDTTSHSIEAEAVSALLHLEIQAGRMDQVEQLVVKLKKIPRDTTQKKDQGNFWNTSLAKVGGLSETAVAQMAIAKQHEETLSREEIVEILRVGNPRTIKALGYSGKVNLEEYREFLTPEIEAWFLDGDTERLKDTQVQLSIRQQLNAARKRELGHGEDD